MTRTGGIRLTKRTKTARVPKPYASFPPLRAVSAQGRAVPEQSGLAWHTETEPNQTTYDLKHDADDGRRGPLSRRGRRRAYYDCLTASAAPASPSLPLPSSASAALLLALPLLGAVVLVACCLHAFLCCVSFSGRLIVKALFSLCRHDSLYEILCEDLSAVLGLQFVHHSHFVHRYLHTTLILLHWDNLPAF